ncbi:hypothetical protein AAG570_001549 [Ranatra chinensis]|uniref:Topoisomerase 6 subunit A/Spo11 TOPRIM domain-containing protein n=1 Tax=Ranatra chinensis TaxID=642074 RepID=A0ABD0Y8V6_9HEMI
MVHGKVQLETVADTKCVLIVEKDAAYHRLIDEGFLDRFGPCIIITGKGYPDMNTRLLVHMIWSQLSLPIYALVDADPFGIEIMCVYRYGSAKMAHLCNRLAVPSVRWLGIHPCDVTVLSPPGYASQQMTDKDKRRAEALLRRPYIACNDEIKRQVMPSTGDFQITNCGEKCDSLENQHLKKCQWNPCIIIFLLLCPLNVTQPLRICC